MSRHSSTTHRLIRAQALVRAFPVTSISLAIALAGCSSESTTGGSGGQAQAGGNGGRAQTGGGGGAGPGAGGSGTPFSGGTSGSGAAAGAGGALDGVGGALSGAGGLGGSGGVGGTGGSVGAVVELRNTYDGARVTTESFDQGWQFHLGDVANAEAPDFDDSSWAALDVPHDWSISLPFNQSSPATYEGGYLDGGVGWYRKTFELPAASAGRSLSVQFDGVYMDSTVWLNGTKICGRPYGYVSFECDLTEAAKLGEANVLAVKVVNQQPSSRWYSGSGIYRHVWLKSVEPVHVAYTGTRITTPEVSGASATVNVAVNVENDGASAADALVRSSAMGPDGAVVATVTSAAKAVEAGGSAEFSLVLTVPSPKLWSTEAPHLYSMKTEVEVGGAVVDTYMTSFGIRTFAFDSNTGFSLNGKPMKIQGVCNHHDLGALGAATNHRAIEKRLELLKEMGANAIRTSHNPPAPELLDMADQMGFLVMDELFDTWYGGKKTYDYGRFFNQWAETDTKDTVARDLNHPSVILWSIGNEVPQTDDSNTITKLMNAVKAKDTTRPIGQALAAWASADTPAVGLEDYVGINYAPERYDPIHAAHPNWKMLGSETSSAFRSRGLYSNSGNQAASYDTFAAGWGHTAEKSWTEVNSRAFIAGEFIWTGFDYIGEPTPYEWPSKSSYFGILDTADFPKDIYYFYQSKWNAGGEPMVHIVPMDWTNWTAGQGVRVLVYTNAESAELFLNGTSLGSKTLAPTAAKLEWSVPFATGTLEAKATRGGTVVATDVVRTASAPATLKVEADRSTIAADGRDLVFVEVDVLDAQGVLVPRAKDLIELKVEGPGVLVGVDNGDATSHESYKGDSRSAFSGKMMAIIQATRVPGTITVTASSGSLEGGTVEITTLP